MAHAPVCSIVKCPNKTYGRLATNNNHYRRDLCRWHFWHTMKHYCKGLKKEKWPLTIVEIWGS